MCSEGPDLAGRLGVPASKGSPYSQSDEVVLRRVERNVSAWTKIWSKPHDLADMRNTMARSLEALETARTTAPSLR